MLIADTVFTGYSATRSSIDKTLTAVDSDDDIVGENFGGHRVDSMTGTGSPTPYIKDEPDDLQYNPHRFMSHNGYDMSQQFGNQHFGTSHGDIGGVNPSDLTMSGSFMGNQYGSHNLSSSFIMGNSNIADDELLEGLVEVDESNRQHGGFNSGMQSQNGYIREPMNGAGGPAPQATNIHQMYSNTPDGAPIQSPFVHDFNYNVFRNVHPQQGYHPNVPTSGSMQNGGFVRTGLERHASDSRSPLTPKTPALGGLHLGTPDSGSFGSQPIAANAMSHRQKQSISGQWEHTPRSAQSWYDSPLSSPHGGSMHHPQISEVLGAGKHASSLPAKVDLGVQGAPGMQSQSQEAKRRRRRESHNLVERRRRDNINERIADLSHLVPMHRLEDEKVRKHINNNGPLSPNLTATGMSPPQATSLLAGGTGRRAAGSITQGLPIEDKDKGPNKGDILNGAVGWTRDLMWMLYRKLHQEEVLRDQILALGGVPAIDETEEEKRMKTELLGAMEANDAASFSYSRYAGSGLRVPKHTNIAGEPLENSISPQSKNQMSPQSISPAPLSGSSGSNSGGAGQQAFWMNQHGGGNQGPFSHLKEEDEFGMEM
ncbi:hypothetical protein H2201_001327 [Coniosporium apollinis]|uniref:BHLH domain-containing protein n=2 Tax=Coniosporium TaxID=2810619 RepID=A0ABQ9P244_9PEZI|nr:hypothetical protein H2199_001737 [Cladosporium sp. JES 115]KAJ9668684.1 hypothetical protein H2201_001327 [Coniosporium apollinis]